MRFISDCSNFVMRHSVLTIFLWLASAAAVADDFEHIQSLRDTTYQLVDSEEVGRSYHVYVMLPETYASEPDRTYRTIYVLDGGTLLPLLAGYYRYLRFADETEESIFVAISYGSDSFEGGNYRATDFTAPSEERDYYGGAPQFQSFLANELMPWVEQTYRSNPGRRILFGHSLGGQFVLHTALTNPSLFYGYIASNPALHRNGDFFRQRHSDEISESRLFVASGTNDFERYRLPAQAWIQHWQAQPDKPWMLETVDLLGHTHVSAPPVVFWRGLSWLESTENDGD